MAKAARKQADPVPNGKEKMWDSLGPIKRGRISDTILVQLVHLILDGELEPGDKFPPERELAMQFDVNRASLREALRRMEAMGLVRVRQGGGFYVQDYNSHGGLEFVLFLVEHGIHLDRKMIADLADMRIRFAKMLLSAAVERIDEESLGDLERTVGDIEGATVEDRYSGQPDFAFYRELARATRNQIFAFSLNTVRDVMAKIIGLYFRVGGDMDAALDLYRGLIESLRQRDEKRAHELLEIQAKVDDARLFAFLEEME
ncbi:MAG: GntR family transcriptional regulator [Candidatus Lernaella stagnicola]|nr:GntR family transcriptional regulator [Candidatus Lernaella stagnicola]